MRWLAIVLALAACKKHESAQPAPVPQLSAEETKRDQDACKAYVDRVCGCADKVAELKKQCELARALPEAMRINLEVAATPDTKPDVARQSLEGVRKTAKECIEQVAKLPAQCP